MHSILAPTQEHAATLYKFKAKFGGMDVSDGRRLKDAGGRERSAEEALGKCSTMRFLKDITSRKCMIRPVIARSFYVTKKTVA